MLRSKLLTLVVFFFIQSCSSNSEDASTEVYHYSKNGVSITVPTDWILLKDTATSLLAEREIAFAIGDFSTLTLLVFDYSKSSNVKDKTLTSLMDSLVERVLLSRTEEHNQSVKKSDIRFGSVAGKKYQVKTTLGEELNDTVWGAVFNNSSQTLLVTLIADDADINSLEKNIDPVFSSVKLEEIGK